MFGKKPEKVERIAVVTVHGTGDSGPPGGEKWWQVGSPFSEGLKQRLQARGVEAEIIPHIWSGANSASDRETGADTLAATIKKAAATHRGVHVIGHSHGGNVANDAADFLRWGRRIRKRRRDPISSITTVGTPYFNSRTALAQKGAGLAFMAITWGSVILFPLTLLTWLILILNQLLNTEEEVRSQMAAGTSTATSVEAGIAKMQAEAWTQFAGWGIYLVLVGLAVRFMWRMSTRGVRRVMRPKRVKTSPATIFSLWHRNDEAISFLKKVDKARIEAFSKGSLYRGSRTSAVGFAVLIIVAIGSAGIVGFFAAHAGMISKSSLASLIGTSVDELSFGTITGYFIALTLIAVFLAPVIFSLVFVAYRYIVGLILEWTARGWLNGRVANTLRGMAFGKDGDQVLGNISPTSHTINSREFVLDGEVAERMRTRAEGGMDALLKKYRWALFDADDDSDTSVQRIAKDAMTWDSLIHTTYFDQPEVADLIADHIANEAKRLGEV